ncbi:MAG: ribosome biogenesis GTPase RsgA [Methylothermaceae bacteria B42]|nr:MAG: ribosome biogenesis GTPase RsgA [Methylothermaceae bacteria B42]HHJ37841.1 ribosome small subunit-dependent GTPase A [Methylothermaceae bacterium]
MGEVRTGRVIAHFGKNWAVEEETGQIFLCNALRRLDQPCVGDWVRWEQTDARHGRIVEILPRKTLLVRPARGGKLRPTAANIDQVFIVIAPQPLYDLLLVDQYLVVCENRGITPIILFNKIDLTDDRKSLEKELKSYLELYPFHYLSAKTGEGMEKLKSSMRCKTSMLAGQSGVGKSSLLHWLVPDKEIRVGELSKGTHRGRHTTTTAMLFHLPEGGDLIDTPGVAVFGLADIDEKQLAHGYKEFRPHIPHCRFNDCRHVNDQGCAVRKAVLQGKIDQGRYRRYLKLREKLPKIS